MGDQIPTVFIVDDDEAVRNSLAWLLEAAPMRVLTFESARRFLDHYQPGTPGCLVLDVRLPGMSGLELQQKLQERGIDLPIIVMSGHADVPMAVQAMKAGAVDFLSKPFDSAELLDRINKALVRDVQQRTSEAEIQAIETCIDALTPREREVMELIVQGHANKEAAQALNVSHRTIEVHRKRVMQKMQAHSLADLVRKVLKVRPELVEAAGS